VCVIDEEILEFHRQHLGDSEHLHAHWAAPRSTTMGEFVGFEATFRSSHPGEGCRSCVEADATKMDVATSLAAIAP
jgi:hypothetical protein